MKLTLAFVHKVLSIASGVLLGICGVIGVICLVYTLASAAVQQGFDALGAAWDSATDSAWATLVDQAQQAFTAATEPVQDAAAEGKGEGLLANIAGVLGLGAGSTADASSAADPALAADYQTWKDAVSSPLERLFGGTGIDATTLEAVAGGSSSATSLLTQLDDPTLTAIADGASSLAGTARSHGVPASLPTEVQEQLHQADEHCASFCERVGKLVEDVRTLKGGNILAGGSVATTAYAARNELTQMESCMQAAEDALGL